MAREHFLGIALAFVAIAAAPAPTVAQQPVPEAAAAATLPPRNVISVNPLGIPFGWFSAEYERDLGSGRSLAAAGSYAAFSDDDTDDTYLSADLKFRYYPGERVFHGFSVGLTGGFASYSNQPLFGSFVEEDQVNALTAGVTLDYGWMLGRRDRFHIGLGIGAKRLFYLGDPTTDPASALPFLRFSVGLGY